MAEYDENGTTIDPIMKKRYIALALFLSTSPWLKAQQDDSTYTNLVYNGSFEEYLSCPRKVDAVGVLTIVEGWYQPTLGSADYFNTCGTRECGVPKNKLGVQEAYDGEGYCGIYCSKNDYREYLQTRLRRRLHKGDSLQVSFFVSLSEESTGAVATLGALFTPDRIGDTTRTLFLNKQHSQLGRNVLQTIATPYVPQVFNAEDRLLSDTRHWQEVSGLFVAQGGEQYITIGNFFPMEHSGYAEPDSLTMLLPGAYYYVDAVTVRCLNCTEPETDDLNPDASYLSSEQPAFTVGETFVLKDIFFEFDKSTLLQQSYFELLCLKALLEVYPTMRIEIRGHTDNRGSTQYNLRLSESRAKAVADYLASKGVDAKRLQYKGYGKSLPIDTNDTDEGRANNRRVEFRILCM